VVRCVKTTSALTKKIAITLCAIALLFGATLAIVMVENWRSDRIPEANAGTSTNTGVWTGEWLLRTPGRYGNNTSFVSAAGLVYPGGHGTDTLDKVRPAVFLKLSSLTPYKPDIQVGTCDSSTDNGRNCIRFGNYAFDIIGINNAGSKSGICTMTENDGYTDNSGAECPNNTLALLLSMESGTKFSDTRFSNGLNHYYNSTLNTVMNSAYSAVSSQVLQPSGPVLSSMILNRSLAGGASDTALGGNKCSGTAPGSRSFFPLSATEASALTQPQSPLTFTQVSKSANSAQYRLQGGSGSGNYTFTTSGVCTGSGSGASAVTITVTFTGAGACNLIGNRAASTGFFDATQLSTPINVRSLTQKAQVAGDAGFDGAAPNNTPAGANPAVIYALGGTTLTLTDASKWTRAGYFYSTLCTAIASGGTCSNAAITNYAMPDANTILYPRWVGNSIIIAYNANNLPGGVAPANGTCTYGTSFTRTAFTSPQSGYSTQGLASAASAWTQYVGNASQSVDAALSTATTTCFGVTSGTKTLYAVWKDVTAPTQVPTIETSTPSPATVKSLPLTFRRTTDIVTPADDLEYRVEIGTTACNVDVTTPFMPWTSKTADWTLDYTDFTPGVAFSVTICARDIAGNYTTLRTNTFTVYSANYDINDATSGSAPATQYILANGNLTTADFSGARTNWTFSGWSTANTVSNAATSCPATHYSASGTIPNVSANLTLYACWLDKTQPTLSSLTAAKTSETNVRFTISADDALSSSATKWKLGTTAGAADLCAEQTLATLTCDTVNLTPGNEVVYYTITDLADNVLASSQEFMSATGNVAISLASTSHGSSPLTTDTDVAVTAEVSTTPSIAVNPHGQITFTLKNPSAIDKTAELLAAPTCNLVPEADPLTNGYKSTCTLNLDAAFITQGQWEISASYNANAGSPTGYQQLISSSSGSIAPIISTTPTYVEFTPPTLIHTVSTNVSISGRICEFDDELGGPDEMELQNCAVLPQGETIHFEVTEVTGAGYSGYISPSLPINADGTFTFTLPQIPLKGTYHLKVVYEGSVTYETSYSQTEEAFEVTGSGLTDGECSIPGYDNVIDCENAGGTWNAGVFAYSIDNSATTTARLDKLVTVTMRAPAKAISLVGDTADNGILTIFMHKLTAGVHTDVSNSTLTHKLSADDCTNACDDSVQNEYSFTFEQPRYIDEPGVYYYTVQYSGNQAIGTDTPLELVYNSSKAFTVQKAATSMTIDAVPDFAYENDAPAPAGVLANVNLSISDYATFPPTGANAAKIPTGATNGDLTYAISPFYDAEQIYYTGVISTTDTNCNPNASDILLGWRGCTYLTDDANPNTRKYKLYLGDYDAETTYIISAHFAGAGNEDVAFSTSTQTRSFQTFIPGFCMIGDVIHAEFTTPAECESGGGTWVGLDAKVVYDLGAHGSFADVRYQNLPDDYFPNPTTLVSPQYVASGGETFGTDVLWNAPAVVTSGPEYAFAGWYKVPNPSSADLPFASTPETVTENLTLYAVYVGPMTGRCSMPQYLTQAECEAAGGVWSEPGPYLVTDKTSVFAGESLNVSGRNFAPNELLDIYLNSDPLLLTMVINNEQGRFNAAEVIITADTTPGRHTISAEPNPAWAGAPLRVGVDVGVQVIVRNNASFECSDPQWTTREDCREHGGGGTWSPCDEPTWSLVTGCDEDPPAPHTPYPLPDNFPQDSDEGPWVCVTDEVSGKVDCTNPEDATDPTWHCDPDGNCWYFPDDWPRNPGWVCTPDGICAQRPPAHPEVVCDVVSNICWEIPTPPWGNPGSGDGDNGNGDGGSYCTIPGYSTQEDCEDAGGEWIPGEPPSSGAPDPWFPLDPDGAPHSAVLPPSEPWVCTPQAPPNEHLLSSCRYPTVGGDYDNPGQDDDEDGIGDGKYWECDLNIDSPDYLTCTWHPESASPTPDHPNWKCNIDASSGEFLECTPRPNDDGWKCNVYGNCWPAWGYKPFADATLKLNKMQAVHDEEFEVSGAGFAPNQPLEIFMHSDPITLGLVVADTKGAFTLPSNIPAADLVETGEHTVVAEDLRDLPAVERSVPLERGPKISIASSCDSPSYYALNSECHPVERPPAPTGLLLTWLLIAIALVLLLALSSASARASAKR
jgi:hypothetical protein